MLEEFELETSDLRDIDDPTWLLFREVATVWTNLGERSSDKTNNLIPENNQLSGPDMKDILANTHDKVAMTMDSCSKAYKHAVGFGNVKRIWAAALALAAAMTCDLNNCEKNRTRRPDFTK